MTASWDPARLRQHLALAHGVDAAGSLALLEALHGRLGCPVAPGARGCVVCGREDDLDQRGLGTGEDHAACHRRARAGAKGALRNALDRTAGLHPELRDPDRRARTERWLEGELTGPEGLDPGAPHA